MQSKLNTTKNGGLDIRYLGQEANKAPVMPVHKLNEKLVPKGKEKAPNAIKNK